MPTISESATDSPGLGVMAGIETRRLARHPAFLIGVVLTFGVTLALFVFASDSPERGDMLAFPIVPAFFMGLTSLVAMARLTRSTEVTAEALGTAPGSEARRTGGLVVACSLPFLAGVVWLAMVIALVAREPIDDAEWWFATMPDWQIWSILVALGPVACLGGALLGVLVGRWLRFPGAPAVAVVAVVAITMLGQIPLADGGSSELRLWVPWAMFHSGGLPDGTATLYAGNPAAYLGYLLCLCAAAALVAIYHDRGARTGQLRTAIAAVTVVGLSLLVVSMTTGIEENHTSDPRPNMMAESE